MRKKNWINVAVSIVVIGEVATKKSVQSRTCTERVVGVVLYVYDVGFTVGDAAMSEVIVDQDVVMVRSLSVLLESHSVNTLEKNL